MDSRQVDRRIWTKNRNKRQAIEAETRNGRTRKMCPEYEMARIEFVTVRTPSGLPRSTNGQNLDRTDQCRGGLVLGKIEVDIR